MERLRVRDVRRLFDVLDELYERCDLNAFRIRILSTLSRLVPAPRVSYNEVNLPMRRNTFALQPPNEYWESMLPDYGSIFTRHMADHPLIVHYRRNSDGQARKISDFLSQREFHALGLYQEVFRPFGAEHQIAVTLPAPPPLLVAIALGRGRGRDFSERERLFLNLLRPHLIQAYRNADAVTRSRRDPSLAVQALGDVDLPYGLILLTSDLRIEMATRQTWELLRAHWGETPRPADRLPEDLERWVRHHLAVTADEVPPAREPFTVERREHRLVVRLVGGADHALLCVEEQPTAVRSAHLASLGLTRREAEVLAWVAHGKTNVEIARILGTSHHTVAHQLQRVYDKLGVETRTAAARLALEKTYGRGPES